MKAQISSVGYKFKAYYKDIETLEELLKLVDIHDDETDGLIIETEFKIWDDEEKYDLKVRVYDGYL